MDAFGQILAGKGGHVIVDAADGATTAYHFWGFIPQIDTTITSLIQGADSTNTNVAQATKTYTAGIFYPAREGYYKQITCSVGAVILYKTIHQPA